MISWDAVLDRLEHDLKQAERLLATGETNIVDLVEPWVAPRTAGPVPDHLRERAADVVRRQDELRERLSARLGRLDHEIRLATPQREPARPRFIDVVG